MKASVIGTIYKDVKPGTTRNGKSFCTFTLRESRKVGDGYKTWYHNFQAWGKLSEVVEKYFENGMPILLHFDQIDYSKYEDSDGIERQSTWLRLSGFDFIPKDFRGQNEGSDDSYEPEE